MIDIQCLNEQNDKLNQLIKKFKEDKSLFDTKIVSLENDIDHYQNKIREYEDFIDELKAQLEDALEENITLQTEFETYKLNTGDQLIRKEEELRDIKNDIANKDKLLQRLSKSSLNGLNIPKVQERLFNDRKIMTDKRRYTVMEKNQDFKFRSKKKHFTQIDESESENIKDTINKNNKYNPNPLNIIMEDSENKKLVAACKTSKNSIDMNNNNNNSSKDSDNDIDNKPKINLSNKILNFNDDTETPNTPNEQNEIEYETKKDDNNKQSTNSNIRLYKKGLNSINKKTFGDLVVCEGNKLYINPLINKILTKEQIKEFKITLKNMLIRTKQRINNIYNIKKSINEKFEKIKNK